MPTPPLPTSRHALFLDFDGTLADIAAQPHAVQLPPGVVDCLQALHVRLEGALAIVTGRTMADIDHFLDPLRLPVACEHGAQYRLGNGRSGGLPALPLQPLLAALRPLMAQHPELLLEAKSAGLALHYRQAPQLQALCLQAITQALREVPGAELLHGKFVYEIKPVGPDKGRAITDFMRLAPFAGRAPLFVGDDVTDEAGFAAAQSLGGLGIKVGEGATRAHARLATPAAVRQWLQQAVGEEIT
ncbi:trehalose-phosphatase [Diaphorobacter sp. MNS-0]|uniref:trehalose-phosphatase n=1 Tax=Diaphorobacter sp. MNS-0 TaxID=2866628 RepID=UPI001C72D4E7|nr:trehalose-phosphatase [Diaphorobacter sp. MNS-0]QYY26109.1 trehalose-phosphatase [Diaphorobacter sp. MNS-0]